MENKLKISQQRAIQYWFADGLAEFLGASICLLLAIYFTTQQFIPQSSFAIFFLLLFLGAFGLRKLMYSLRQRGTYQRTGYVKAMRGLHDRRMRFIAITFTVILLALMLSTILQGIDTFPWLSAMSGVTFAFLFFLTAIEANLCRFYYLAGFSILLGIGLTMIRLGNFWGAAIHSLILAVSLAAFGIRTRLNYLRHSAPLLEQEDEF
jgi:hypothetical protein